MLTWKRPQKHHHAKEHIFPVILRYRIPKSVHGARRILRFGFVFLSSIGGLALRVKRSRNPGISCSRDTPTVLFVTVGGKNDIGKYTHNLARVPIHKICNSEKNTSQDTVPVVKNVHLLHSKRSANLTG